MGRAAVGQLGLFSGLPAGDDSGLPVSLVGASERDLAGIALSLGAHEVRGWSEAEGQLSKAAQTPTRKQVEAVRSAILRGCDPLGTLFCRIRTPDARRPMGATYTPRMIVEAMLHWAASEGDPIRVVDPGTGSARYLLEAARRFERASLIGVEADPLAALIGRANLAVAGYASRSYITLGDYRSAPLPRVNGRTLYVGNPPYVRHHLLGATWKAWLARKARALGFNASQLAGLHVYFFLATILKAAPGDYGAFITGAEWLDVNYGSFVRELFLGPLGGKRIIVVEPTAEPFPDAATTAAITYFEIGSKPKRIRLKRVKLAAELASLNGNRLVRRERLESESRWSHLTRNVAVIPQGYVELGELCRVHRGQVTGSNRVWIDGPHSCDLSASVLFPSVTKARELISAGKVLDDASRLRRVIDLPTELDAIDRDARAAVERFLAYARRLGAHLGYVATNRRSWWSVGLRAPAPILATYMARRPPAFVRNRAAARHINVAHGLYPREALAEAVLDRLVDYLSAGVSVANGRTYAGGLTKFEPREMERLPVPEPAILMQMEA